MNNQLVSLMFGVGVGGWVYYKMMRQTGGNTQNSLLAAAGVGLVGAFVIYTLFAWVFPASN